MEATVENQWQNGRAVRVSEVRTEAERASAYRLRYRVYLEEMGKPCSSADHARAELRDELDACSTILLARLEWGEVVGTIRTTWGEDLARCDRSRLHLEWLDVGSFPHAVSRTMCCCSRLVVASHARRKGVVQALMMATWEAAQSRGVRYCLITAQPHLMGLFSRWGFQQCCDPFHDRESDTTQVPMVLDAHDHRHLAGVGSPFVLGGASPPRVGGGASLESLS